MNTIEAISVDHEQELVDILRGGTIRLGEHEVAELRTVDEHTVLTGGVVATRGVILPIEA